MPLLELRNVSKRYGTLDGGRVALDSVSLSIRRGELVAVLGTSGSGKSTLLHVLGALDLDFTGTCVLDGRDLRGLSDRDTSGLRQRLFGFVFQSFHLVPTWTVAQNVSLPGCFAPAPLQDLPRRVEELLALVGLSGRGKDLPTALSGGQRQRVAIARALLLRPPVLLCDEPTGSLDASTGASLLDLFATLHRAEGLTVVIVTHEERATAIAQRVVRLEDGRIVQDGSEIRAPEGSP